MAQVLFHFCPETHKIDKLRNSGTLSPKDVFHFLINVTDLSVNFINKIFGLVPNFRTKEQKTARKGEGEDKSKFLIK